jgi:hypothetical protein
MADKKISELTAAASVLKTDVVPVVNNAETKKVSLDTLWKSVVDFTMSGIFRLNGVEATASSGAISLTEYLTTLTNVSGADAAFSLAAGQSGQFKMLSVTSANSTLTVSVPNGNGFTSIQFANPGDSCVLYYTNKWHVSSNNGGVLA